MNLEGRETSQQKLNSKSLVMSLSEANSTTSFVNLAGGSYSALQIEQLEK